jgi:hypothetical protein
MMAGMRRPVTVLGPFLAVALLAGCATSVDGTGSTSAFRSSPLPPGSSTSTPSPTDPAPSGTIPSGNPSSGNLVSDTAGHIQIRLNGNPNHNVENTSVGNEKLTLYVNSAPVPDKEEAVTETYSPALPPGGEESVLRGAVGGFAGSSGFTLGTQAAVTFRGRPGRTATFTDATVLRGQYTFLALVWSTTRTYIFFAPSGAKFNDMMASFEAIG